MVTQTLKKTLCQRETFHLQGEFSLILLKTAVMILKGHDQGIPKSYFLYIWIP